MKNYQTYGDVQLFDLIRKGEQKAYAEMYGRYWAVLYRHALHMVRDEEMAEDILQDVFLNLWDKAPQIHLRSNIANYLYTAVRNRIFDQWSHARVKEKYADSYREFLRQGVCETDFMVREKELRRLIEQEVASLPENLRKSFELSRNAHLTYHEISEELGISENSVRNNVSRALKVLKDKFGDMVVLYFIFLN